MKKKYIKKLMALALVLPVVPCLATDYTGSSNNCSDSVCVVNDMVDGHTLSPGDKYIFTITVPNAEQLTDFTISGSLGTTGQVQVSSGPFYHDNQLYTEPFTINGNTAVVTVYKYNQQSINVSVSWTAKLGNLQIQQSSVSSCPNGNTGTASVSVSGGTGSYLYLWTNTECTTNSLTNLSAGEYSVQVTDANCSSLTNLETVTVGSLAEMTLSGNDPDTICPNTTTSAFVSVSNGSGNYSFSWNKSSSVTNIASELSAGSYEVTVTDNVCTGMSGKKTFKVTSYPELTLSGDNPATICPNQTTSATVNVTGGSGLYSYSWDKSSSTSYTASDLVKGSNVVTVTDALCTTMSDTKTFVVSEFELTLTGNEPDKVCPGSTTSATVCVSGGTGSYSYSWDKSSSITNTANNLTKGDYKVTVADIGCESLNAAKTFTVNTFDEILLDEPDITDNSCYGASEGSITVKPTGGTNSYSYLWGDNSTAQSLSGLPAGSYAVLVSDGCSNKLGVYTVKAPVSDLAISGIDVTDIKCGDASSSKLVPHVFGGSGNMSYSWKDEDNMVVSDVKEPSGLKAGNYQLVLSDNVCGKSYTSDFVQIKKYDKISVSLVKKDVSCSNKANGQLVAAVTGGKAPMSFSWKNASNIQVSDSLIADSLYAGTYKFTVIDACETVTAEATIDRPQQLSMSVVKKDVTCYEGSDGLIELTASGGSGSYTYLLNDNTSSTPKFTRPAGVYSVKVADLYCQDTVSELVTLTEPSELVIEDFGISKYGDYNVSCYGAKDGYLIANVSGGTAPYTFKWTKNGTTLYNGPLSMLSNIGEGSYKVSVTDACSKTQNSEAQELNQVDGPLKIESSIVKDVSYSGTADGEISIESVVNMAGNTLVYKWNDGNANIKRTDLSEGAYSVTITDENSCKYDTTFIISKSTTKGGGVIYANNSDNDVFACDSFLFGNAIYSSADAEFQGAMIGPTNVRTYDAKKYSWYVRKQKKDGTWSTWSVVEGAVSNTMPIGKIDSVCQYQRKCQFDYSIKTWYGSVTYESNILTITPVPVEKGIIVNLNPHYCNDEESVTIYGLPSNGEFFGQRITTNGYAGQATFIPNLADNGIQFGQSTPILYKYTDSHGCIDSVSQSVMVDTVPQIAIKSIDLQKGQSYKLSDYVDNSVNLKYEFFGDDVYYKDKSYILTTENTIVGDLVKVNCVATTSNGCSSSIDSTFTVNAESSVFYLLKNIDDTSRTVLETLCAPVTDSIFLVKVELSENMDKVSDPVFHFMINPDANANWEKEGIEFPRFVNNNNDSVVNIGEINPRKWIDIDRSQRASDNSIKVGIRFSYTVDVNGVMTPKYTICNFTMYDLKGIASFVQNDTAYCSNAEVKIIGNEDLGLKNYVHGFYFDGDTLANNGSSVSIDMSKYASADSVTHHVLRYQVKQNINGCVDESVESVIITKIPILETNIEPLYNYDGEGVELTAISTNGVDADRVQFFRANSNIENNQFYPATANVGYHNLRCEYSYKYGDSLSCTSKVNVDSVLVEKASGSWLDGNGKDITDAKVVLCQNGQMEKFYVKTDNSIRVNGKYGKFYINDTLVENGNVSGLKIDGDTLWLDPVYAPKGKSVINFKYNCSYNSSNVELSLKKEISIESWDSLSISCDSIICSNGENKTITAKVGYGNANNSLFKINDVDADNSLEKKSGSEAVLYPSLDGSVGDNTLYFIYNYSDNCKDTASRKISIKAPYDVNFALPSIINFEGDAKPLIDFVTVADNNIGGVLKYNSPKNGKSVFAADNYLSIDDSTNISLTEDANSKIAESALNVNVKYTYTDPNNCVSEVSKSVYIDKPRGHFYAGSGSDTLPSDFCQADELVPFYVVISNDRKFSQVSSTCSSALSDGTIGSFVTDKGQGQGDLSIKDINLFRKGDGESYYYGTMLYNYNLLYNGDSALFTLKKDIRVIVPDAVNVSADKICYVDEEINLDSIVKVNNGNEAGIAEKIYKINEKEVLLINPVKDKYAQGATIPVQCTIKYSKESTCSSVASANIKIYDPVISSISLMDRYCSNDAIDTVLVAPKGASLFFDGDQVTIQNERLYFDPAQYRGKDVEAKLIFNYGDNNVCSDSLVKRTRIYEAPNLSIGNLKESYCDGDTVSLAAYNNGESLETGIFILQNESRSIRGNVIAPNDYRVKNDKLEDWLSSTAEYEVSLSYTDPLTSCSSQLNDKKIVVNPLPVLNIDGLKDKYCSGDGSEIMGIVDGNKAKSGTITIDGAQFPYTTSFYSSQYINDTVNVDSSKVTVPVLFSYVESATGCSNEYVKNIDVYASPKAGFEEPNVCLTDDYNVKFQSNSESKNPIDYYYWVFGDGKDAKIGGDTSFVVHRYTEADVRNLSLTVSDSNGCQSTYRDTLTFVFMPEPNFIWDNECATYNSRSKRIETKVNFKNSSIASGNVTYKWSFGENIAESSMPQDLSNLEKNENPSVTFLGTGANAVTLKTYITEQCQASITRTVYIRPTDTLRSDKSFMFDFEDGTRGWDPEATAVEAKSSWSLGQPNGSIVKSAASGDNCWITGLDTSYYISEASAITSPCFDFSNLDRPMISMNIFNQTEKDHDGVVLQYATDSALTWTNVGLVGGGINWYNSQGISSRPGGSIQGWSGADSTHWYNVRYDLDAVKNKPNVRFRIAFASDAGGAEYDGFAFDDIVIGNRTRRVLIEHFTNIGSDQAVKANAIVDGVRMAMPSDAISIQYHTSYPDGDKFYQFNPMAGAIRENYYGVNAVPYSVVDGTNEFDYRNDAIIDTLKVKTRALYSPSFNIELKHNVSGNQYNVSVALKALENITDRQLILFTAIVEKEVNDQNVVYRNVLRQMLPLPSGEYISETWSLGQSCVYNYSFTPGGGINSDKLDVVAFVQDEISGEILQTATTNSDSVAHPYTDIALANVAYGNAKVSVFPNPASDKLSIMFDEPVDGIVEFINQQGFVVKRVDLESDSYGVTIDVSNMRQGLYIVRSVISGGVSIARVVIQ